MHQKSVDKTKSVVGPQDSNKAVMHTLLKNQTHEESSDPHRAMDRGLIEATRSVHNNEQERRSVDSDQARKMMAVDSASRSATQASDNNRIAVDEGLETHMAVESVPDVTKANDAREREVSRRWVGIQAEPCTNPSK